MAIQIIREVNADVVKRGSTRAVYAKQNDINSRFLNVRIQEDGNDIVVKPDLTVILNVSRPDRADNLFYGTVNEDGTVKVPLTAWMLELEGTLVCDISIVSEDPTISKLTTMQFNIYVEAAVVTDAAIEETEEYSIIVDLLKRTQEAAELAEEAAKNATTLKENCETATEEAVKASGDVNKALAELAAGGFIKSMEEQNKGEKVSYWIGSRAEYDALTEIDLKRVYIVYDEKPSVSMSFTVDVPHTSWVADEVNGGYICNVPVIGILSTDNPIVDVLLSEDIAYNDSCLEAWSYVTRITTSEDYITLFANKNVPTTDFTIQLKVVR